MAEHGSTSISALIQQSSLSEDQRTSSNWEVELKAAVVPEDLDDVNNIRCEEDLHSYDRPLLNPIDLLSTLAFPEKDLRLAAIEEAQESTFDWIFEKRQLRFMEWILSGEGLYWIRGKPGSGKSTLMRYLHDNDQFREALKSRITGKSQTDVWFFFNERGTFLQKSLDGLLRNLLHRLASSDQRLGDLILKVYFSKPRQIRGQWLIDDIHDAFQAIMAQEHFDIEITIFLDALDEFQGFPDVISRWLLNLTTRSQNPQGRTKIRCCFSSRPWDSFVRDFDHSAGFSLHEHTTDDIRLYVTKRVSQLTLFRQSFTDLDSRLPSKALPQTIVSMIEARAEGVFLWVKLAMDELSLLPSSANQADMELLIDKLPEELEQFYATTITRIPKHSRIRAFTLLEIILRSEELLSPKDLFYAAECGRGNTFQQCAELLSYARIHAEGRENVEEISKELLNLCGGLLDCVQTSPKAPRTGKERKITYIQFIHRTVRDFVSSPEFPQLILGDLHTLQSENGYSFLMKYQFIRNDNTQRPGYKGYKVVRLAHQDEVSNGRPATAFLDSIPKTFFGRPNPLDPLLHNPYTCSFTFGVVADLRLYVQGLLVATELSSTNTSRPKALNAVAWAACQRWRNPYPVRDRRSWELDLTEMTKILLNHGFDNKDELFGFTPFETLFKYFDRPVFPVWESWPNELVTIVQVLIQYGVQNPNRRLRTLVSRSKLLILQPKPVKRGIWPALHLSSGLMTKMLLDNGADPNVLDARGRSALDHFIYSLVEYDQFFLPVVPQTLSLLLSHGALLTKHGAKSLPKLIEIWERYKIPPPQLLEILKTTLPLANSVSPDGTRVYQKSRKDLTEIFAFSKYSRKFKKAGSDGPLTSRPAIDAPGQEPEDSTENAQGKARERSTTNGLKGKVRRLISSPDN